MSAEGPHGTYVNSFGYVHELITLKKVKNTYAEGPPQTQYSWFPGYVRIITAILSKPFIFYKYIILQQVCLVDSLLQIMPISFGMEIYSL